MIKMEWQIMPKRMFSISSFITFNYIIMCVNCMLENKPEFEGDLKIV